MNSRELAKIRKNVSEVLNIIRLLLDICHRNPDVSLPRLVMAVDLHKVHANMTNSELLALIEKNVKMYNLLNKSELDS